MKHIRVPVLFATMLFASTQLNAQHKYKVSQTFPVYGLGKWDYIAVGPDNNLYVSNSSQVNIINKNTGDSVGVITGTEGVHGIAFDEPQKKGYTSNGAANNVTIFDLTTHKQLGKIPTGQNPDAIFYESYSKKIITCNGRSQDLSIIDPVTDKVVSTVNVAGRPETAVSDGKGMLYVNIEDKSEIVAIDLKKMQVTNRWSLAPAEGPTGLAIDRATGRLFAACEKVLVVLNTNGKIITRLPIGEGCDGVAFDNESKVIFTANGEGTITVIKEKSANNFEVLENVTTQKNARTIALDEVSHTIYLPVAEFGPKAPNEKRGQIIAKSFKVLAVK
ncbi:YncE family protein [Chitinophaga silvatica]|uniref:YncE family protein n=1 Tax=Chitinophaga silvatica TaxID=2282649 RepID=A0A3E1YHT3_9BACT|nr:YncE family protein [Chitinophaga silvatica]RFS26908.1 YncE family protein [Chitinophaga silvatica]